MIIDTSVLVAILLSEPEDADYVQAIAAAPRRLVPVSVYVETGLKLIGLGRDARAELDLLVSDLQLTLVDLTVEQARIAVEARDRYGGRPAQLNFGDCLVYAVAKSMGEPLLFKGGDFSRTDVALAI